MVIFLRVIRFIFVLNTQNCHMKKLVTLSLLLASSISLFSQSLLTDAVFGINGTASSTQGGTEATAILRQTDDKIIVCGNVYDGACNCTYNQMFRVDACGTIDSTFGVNGFVQHTFDQRNSGHDYVLQPDGKILCCGIQASSNAGSQQFPFIARYNSDGSVDTTFGTYGSTKISSYGANSFGNIFLMPDGKIICSNGPLAMRFLTDGSVDASFGNNGGLVMPSLGYYESHGFSSVLRSDGIIVGASTVLDFGFSFPSLGVFAYDTTGVIDSTFGTNGYLQDFAGGIAAYSIRSILQSNDKVIIAGINPNGIHITRVTTSGQIDTTFGVSGYLDFSPGGELFSLVKLNNDRFFVGYRLSGVGNFFKVFDSNGNLDTTLTLNGSNTDMGDLGILNVALVEANDDITFGGTSFGFPYRISRLVTSSATSSISQIGDTLFANVADTNCTFQWYENGAEIEGATENNYIFSANGNYSVVVTTIWGCENSDDFEVTTIGTSEIAVNAVKIYPVPAKNNLTVQFFNPISHATIALHDLTGKMVFEKQISSTTSTQIDVSAFAKGTYNLQIVSKEGKSNHKIIVQ
jgi:uncharacterized delta-60 repeat protein